MVCKQNSKPFCVRQSIPTFLFQRKEFILPLIKGDREGFHPSPLSLSAVRSAKRLVGFAMIGECGGGEKVGMRGVLRKNKIEGPGSL